GVMTSFIQMGVLVLVGLAVLVVALGWGWWEVEDHKNDLYIITPNGVRDVYKKPFGPEDVNSAGLDKIQNVTFETTFISNFLGYGDVFLKTAGTGKDFTFERVPHPREVVATINDYLAEYKRGERERSLNDTLALLRFYYEDWHIQQSQQRNDEV
nr:PH domain-containing protein [Chloroflexaceae bacterium]